MTEHGPHICPNRSWQCNCSDKDCSCCDFDFLELINGKPTISDFELAFGLSIKANDTNESNRIK